MCHHLWSVVGKLWDNLRHVICSSSSFLVLGVSLFTYCITTADIFFQLFLLLACPLNISSFELPFLRLYSDNPLILTVVFLVFRDHLVFLSLSSSTIFRLSFKPCVQPIPSVFFYTILPIRCASYCRNNVSVLLFILIPVHSFTFTTFPCSVNVIWCKHKCLWMQTYIMRVTHFMT